MSISIPRAVHRIELLVIDHNHLGRDLVKSVLETARYPRPTLSISPLVQGIETKVVDWNDNHPLNSQTTQAAEYHRIFSTDQRIINLQTALASAVRVADGYLTNALSLTQGCAACAEHICCGYSTHNHEACVFTELAKAKARIVELEDDARQASLEAKEQKDRQ